MKRDKTLNYYGIQNRRNEEFIELKCCHSVDKGSQFGLSTTTTTTTTSFICMTITNTVLQKLFIANY